MPNLGIQSRHQSRQRHRRPPHHVALDLERQVSSLEKENHALREELAQAILSVTEGAADAELLENVRELVDLDVQIPVRERPPIARLPFPDNRRAIAS